MYNKYNSFCKLAILFFVLFFSANFSFAQYEINPNDDNNSSLDRIPSKFLLNPHFDGVNSTVETLNDYDNFNLGVDQGEPHLVMNPTAPNQYFVAYNINGAHYTMDGFSWNNITPNFGTSMAGDPVAGYDSLGNLFYSNMYGSITGLKVMKSTNNGATWGTAVTAVLGVDKNWIAVDQTGGPYSNYIYATMTSGSASTGNFARSTDGGATFTTTTTLSGQVLPGMMPCVGPYNNIQGKAVYVVTHGGTNAAGTYSFYRSTDGGLTFTFMSAQNFSNIIGTEISGRSTVRGMRTRPYPMISADNSYGPNRGRLYLVYASNLPVGTGNKPDVFCRYSTDGGATWSAAVTVNDDLNSENNHSFFPAIWTDRMTGRLFVKFYDSRNVPTSDSMDVYATYSDNGGVSFAPNQRITTRPMKITLYNTTSANYQGDYDAITSLNNQSLLAWTDFRNNGFGSYAGYFPDYAMKVVPAVTTLWNDQDSVDINCSVPSIKLYDKYVKFTASITPVPSQGSIQLRFTNGDSLTTFPGSKNLRLRTYGSVPPGAYTLTVVGVGPNGTPIHKRSSSFQFNNFIPVELVSFKADVSDKAVHLNWLTATELNNAGFEIERATFLGENKPVFEKIGFVKGNGTTTERHNYSFSDNSVTLSGSFYYRLKQVDVDGKFNHSKEVLVELAKPLAFSLDQNFPNPFNPSTKINYSIPLESRVKVTIYDALGKEVTQLVDGVQAAARHEVSFNAVSFASGAYFYSIEANPTNGSESFRQIRKMLLIK